MGVSVSLSRANSSTRSSIRIKVSIANTSFMVYPGLSVETALWDKKKSRVQSKSLESSAVNSRLDEVISGINRHLINFKYLRSGQTYLDLKHSILDEFSPNYSKGKDHFRSHNIREFFSGMISDMEEGRKLTLRNEQMAKSTIYSYSQSFKYFCEFETKTKSRFTFSTFKNREISAFRTYMSNVVGLSPNTLDKIMSHLSSVFHYAGVAGRIEEGQLRLLKFKFHGAPKNNSQIYLSQAEVDELMALNLTTDLKLDLARDLFIVGCYTGMRASDLLRLNDFAVVGDKIHIKQQKTKGKAIVLIHTVVENIYNKYGGKFPKISYHTYYSNVKRLGELLPSLNEEIIVDDIRQSSTKSIIRRSKFATHTARRTFVTLRLMSGNSPDSIMRVAGFKNYRSFLIYVRASSEELAEKAAEFWGL